MHKGKAPFPLEREQDSKVFKCQGRGHVKGCLCQTRASAKAEGAEWLGLGTGEEIIQYGKWLSLARAEVMQKTVGES